MVGSNTFGGTIKLEGEAYRGAVKRINSFSFGNGKSDRRVY